MLIEGYLPANFLAIRIQCFRCGAVTTTPGLPDGEILTRSAIAVAARQTPMVSPSLIGPGHVLACEEAMKRDYALTRPHTPPDEPLLLSRAMLEQAASAYDNLTGGRLAEHTAASPAADGEDHGPYPFAWSVMRLRERFDRPGWSWLHEDNDAMAAMYVSALHHAMLCWGRHPLLDRLAAALAQPDRYIRTIARFAVAKLLYDSGNRAGFSLSENEPELHFTTPADEPLGIALLAPAVLQWRQKERRNPDIVRDAVVDAMGAAQGRINRSRPGIIVLASSILQPGFDQMMVDATHAAFQSAGRRHRGVAAVAIIVPKVQPAGQLDRVGFGYAFYPIRNPRFAGENPVRLGAASDHAAMGNPFTAA